MFSDQDHKEVNDITNLFLQSAPKNIFIAVNAQVIRMAAKLEILQKENEELKNEIITLKKKLNDDNDGVNDNESEDDGEFTVPRHHDIFTCNRLSQELTGRIFCSCFEN